MLKTTLYNLWRPLRKYAVFSERASRAEYWTFTFACMLIGLALVVLDRTLWLPVPLGDYGVLELVFSVLVLTPGIAVTTRRLHDVDKSGWWQLVVLLPFGYFFLLIFLAERGTEGPNSFGDDPYGDPVLATLGDEELRHAFDAGSRVECPYCSNLNSQESGSCEWCGKAYLEPLTEVQERAEGKVKGDLRRRVIIATTAVMFALSFGAAVVVPMLVWPDDGFPVWGHPREEGVLVGVWEGSYETGTATLTLAEDHAFAMTISLEADCTEVVGGWGYSGGTLIMWRRSEGEGFDGTSLVGVMRVGNAIWPTRHWITDSGDGGVRLYRQQ